jgi:hypothetical protein
MKKIILEVLSFIKNPDDQRIENWSLKTNIKYIFYILFFEFILNMVVINAIIYVINKIEPIVTNTRIIYEDNKLLPMLIAASLWAPLIEEIIFRLGLRYNKFYSVFINRKRWDFIFRFLVYFTVLAFGFVHSVNFLNDSTFFYWVLPLLVATQTIGGFILTFLRVRFNFISSLFAHVLWNFSMMLIFIVSPYFFKPYVKENESYSVKIEQLSYSQVELQKFEVDSSANKVFKLKINEYSLNHVLDTLFQHERLLEDYVINLHFESKKGTSKEDLKKLLLEYDKEENQ